jgi:hypothetical protein
MSGSFKKNVSPIKKFARVLNISMKKIDCVKKRFVEKSFDIALNAKKGSLIYTKKTDGDFEAHLIAVSCSYPPEKDIARWLSLIILIASLTKQYVVFLKKRN